MGPAYVRLMHCQGRLIFVAFIYATVPSFSGFLDFR